MDFSSKNTRMGCHFLLQGIFPTQGSNLCLLHGQVASSPLSHLGSPARVSSELLNVHRVAVLTQKHVTQDRSRKEWRLDRLSWVTHSITSTICCFLAASN